MTDVSRLKVIHFRSKMTSNIHVMIMAMGSVWMQCGWFKTSSARKMSQVQAMGQLY